MNIYNKFQGKDSFSRYIECFYKKQIQDIAILLNNSETYSKQLNKTSIHFFHETHEELEGVMLLPHLQNKLTSRAATIKEHVAYDSNLKPLFHANFIRPYYTGYSDHKMLPHFPIFTQSLRKTRVIREPTIYLGTFLFHYGHFILETLTRIRKNLPVKNKNIKFVFHIPDGHVTESVKEKILSGYWLEYLQALKIDIETLIFIDQPTIFRKMKILSQSLVLSHSDCFFSNEVKFSAQYINESMATLYNGDKTSPPDKIYVSRVATKNKARQLVNELEVESFFQKKGFKIIRPEELNSEYEKHFLLSKTKIIAGVTGSGLLNSFFIPEGATVIALEFTVPPNAGINHQIQIDHTCGHTTYIYFSNIKADDKKLSFGKVKWAININDLEQKLMANKALSALIS